MADISKIEVLDGTVYDIKDATARTGLSGKADNVDMTGATSSTAGAHGLVPAPSAGDESKFLSGDGTWIAGGRPMVILSYGSSTWADFEYAYKNNIIVYCRASSNSNPASGSQTRMAFMAYVNNADTPTNVEFQYYRSVSSHSSSQMGDQVFFYKLDKTSGWSVTTREASIKEIKAATNTPLSVSWSSNVVTLTNTMTANNMPMSSSDATTAKAAIEGKADLVSGATSGNFASLDSSGNLVDSGNKASDFLTSHQDITGKADKVTSATDGNFAALDSNGNLTDSGHSHSDYLTSHQDITGKADKVSGATNGNFAALDSNGNLTDSGSKASDFITDISGKTDKVNNATSGNFAALDSNGNLTDSGNKASDFLTSHQDITGKADKVSNATSGNFASLDSNGNLTDSGSKASDFLTSHQDITGKADKTNTVLETTLSCGRAGDTGEGSFAFGRLVEASAMYSHAEGNTTHATGSFSHSEGQGTTASGTASHAEGMLSTASNSSAHAEGTNATASGYRAHAEGYNTVASATNSHAEGESTIANGNNLHASGQFNVADSYDILDEWVSGTSYNVGDKVKRTSGDTVRGYVCIVANSETHFYGDDYWQNLDGKMNFAEIVGNGADTNNRSNARALDWDGNEYLAGDLYVHALSNSTGGTKVATISDIPDVSGKISSTEKGAANGVAELDANGKVPSSQLPSYVDDVLEYSSVSAFPATGESGIIYVDTTANTTYRWSGSDYVAIGSSLALGETSDTAYRGDRGASAYAHAVTNKGSAFSSGLYKITTNSEGHVTAATAVEKSDITGLGIPGSDTDTHRPIQVNGTQALGDNTTALNLKNGTNVTITNSSGEVTIAATDTTYESKQASSGGTDLSLVTTGEKYTWNSKTSNTGTVTKVSTGAGLTGGDVTTTGTIKANLTSETKLTNAAADGTETSGRVYPVRLDTNGKLAVNVPWANDDTKNTAGTTNKTGTKMYLAAATSQGANPQTYSNSNCYIGTDNCLYSGGTKVLTAHQDITGKVSKSGDTMSGKLTLQKGMNSIVTGTGTDGQAGSSTVTYIPSLWTFSLGATPSEGDLLTIKIPVAGVNAGVYISVDGGTTYAPATVNIQGTLLTTHYAVGNIIQLVYLAGQTLDVYPRAGGTAKESYTGGIWELVNFYDTNTTYSSMSSSEFTTGTATSKRVLTAANIKAGIKGAINAGSTPGHLLVYDKDIEIGGGGYTDVALDTVTNTSGSYSHTTTVSGVTADMKAIHIEYSNPSAFMDSVTITTAANAITLACDEVAGTSDVTVTLIG